MRFNPLFLIPFLLLSSCSNVERGYFIGAHIYFCEKDDKFYSIAVSEISEKEYLDSNGFNVVKDAFVGRQHEYFKIGFCQIENNEVKTKYDFNNLDFYSYSSGTGFGYIDSNSNKIHFYSSLKVEVFYKVNTEQQEEFVFELYVPPHQK